jgi:hypothetical protein
MVLLARRTALPAEDDPEKRQKSQCHCQQLKEFSQMWSGAVWSGI